jgi:hypothetical protein
VGGNNGSHIAMVADGFLRVMAYLPETGGLRPIGEEGGGSQSIGLNNSLIPGEAAQVALSQTTMPLKLAIASGGQLSIWHWKDQGKDQKEEWQVGLLNYSLAENNFQEDIPTSCSISGNGMVAAVGVIIRDAKASKATVQIFDYNNNSMLPDPWTQQSSSISIPDVKKSQNTIRVALSYGGDVLAILTDNSVLLKERVDDNKDNSMHLNKKYDNITYSWSDLDLGNQTNFSGFVAMALSGDGSTLALTRQEETFVFICNKDSNNEWEKSNDILSGGVDVSLSYAGDIVAIGNPNNTTVSLWRQTTTSEVRYERDMDQMIEGDAQSDFGASVAMARNSTPGESGLLLAIGAPMEGSVHVYEIPE